MNSLYARWVRFYARTEPEINLELCARVEMHRASLRVCTRESIFPRQTKVTLVKVAAATPPRPRGPSRINSVFFVKQ
jgi:hypothetical protein